MTYKARLDGLRFIAILMVLLGHFVHFIATTNSGIYGVNMFFVLSGFLITSILLKQKDKNFGKAYRNFIGRRAFRIFPIYYLLIFFFIIIGVDRIATDWISLVTYTFNFHVGMRGDWAYFIYGPYWSLSVEEQFYVFFPIIILLLNRKPNWQLFAIILIIFLAFFQRKYNILGMSTHHYINLITNMGTLALGALGAWLTEHKKLPAYFFNSVIIEVVFLIFLFLVFHQGENIIGFISYPLINLYLVLKASSFNFKIVPIDKLLTHKWTLFMGKISYGLYLYHIMILHFFTDYIFNPLWHKIDFEKLGIFYKLQYNSILVKFPFVMFFTILIAYLSFKFIESPLLKLKDKYFINT